MSFTPALVGINKEAGLIVDASGRRVVNEWSYQYVVGDALMRSKSDHGWYISCGTSIGAAVLWGRVAAMAGTDQAIF